MKLKRLLVSLTALLAGMAISSGCVWAASGNCSYAGSRADTGGTGMGGTGDVAQGTGIGGTGMSLGVFVNELHLAGNVTSSQGAVEAQSNGQSRFLSKGDPVCVGDTIMASPSGSVQIRMTDGGLVTIQPHAQLKIEKYVYQGTDRDSSLLVLLRGACHIVTGKIGKQHPNDLIKTPNATIHAFEADHEPSVILPDEGGSYPSGTYDKVNSGTAFIRTEKGKIGIHFHQVGFAASNGELPVLLQEAPGFYNVNSSVK